MAAKNDAATEPTPLATRLLEARTHLRDFERRCDADDVQQQQVLREMREHVGALERLAGEWVRIVCALAHCGTYMYVIVTHRKEKAV